MKNSKNDKKKKKFKFTFNVKDILYIVTLSVFVSIAIQKSFTLEHLAGGFLISFIAISILYRDIFRYKPPYINQYKMLILLGMMFIGTITFGRAAEYLLLNFSKGLGFIPQETVIYGIPIAAGAVLVSLLFDFHTAIIFSFIISILSGIWLNDAHYIFYVFIGSFIGGYSVLRCKKRTDIISGGIFISGINTVAVVVISLYSDKLSPSWLIPSLLFATTSGITVSAIVSIFLPIIEHIFKVTTDISLLELLDLNQPLMKNLMINAPGTYHHSVILGNLVETAAEDVGVNPLLARVGAYYHDIGKIKMPEYFVENQASPFNRHDKLTPNMSSMILVSHVKEGLELADEYKLPEPIKDIIKEHHGTSLITYFYQKAKEEQTEVPSEEKYRYPGPRPQSRVAALVMMADAVEAASRVLKEPTPARVSGLVEKIINNIFIAGQLDECELTLKDLYHIKKRFSYILNSILHKRIDYPGFDFEDKKETATEETIKNGSSDKESAAKNTHKDATIKKGTEAGTLTTESEQR